MEQISNSEEISAVSEIESEVREAAETYLDKVTDFSYSTMKEKLLALLSECSNLGTVELPSRNVCVFSEEKGYHVLVPGKKRLQRSTCDLLILLLRFLIEKLTCLIEGVCLVLISTIRDLYYYLMNNKWYEGKLSIAKIRSMVDDICCYFRCTRKSLGIVSESDGVYLGNIIVIRQDICSEGEVEEDGSRLLQPFPIHYSNIKDIRFHPTKPKPLCILVVEKLSLFYELMFYKFHTSFPCLVITGMGMPSQECRMFVKQVSDTLKIPVLGLVDMNPSGYEIFKTYKYGSTSLAFMSANLTVPNMEIIGIFHSDVENLLLENYSDLQPLSDIDTDMLNNQLEEDWLFMEPGLMDSVVSMLRDDIKADIEIISFFRSCDYLVNTFLKRKIKDSLGHGA